MFDEEDWILLLVIAAPPLGYIFINDLQGYPLVWIATGGMIFGILTLIYCQQIDEKYLKKKFEWLGIAQFGIGFFASIFADLT